MFGSPNFVPKSVSQPVLVRFRREVIRPFANEIKNRRKTLSRSIDRLPKTRSLTPSRRQKTSRNPSLPNSPKPEPFLSRTKNERSKNWLRLHPLPFGRKSLGPSLKPIPKNNPKPHPRPTRRQKQNKIASDGRQSPACSPSLPKIEDFPSLLPPLRSMFC